MLTHEYDSEIVITSNPYFAATSLISLSYAVIKPVGGKNSLKLHITRIPSKLNTYRVIVLTHINQLAEMG